MEISFLNLKKNFQSIKDEIHSEIDTVFNDCDFINGKHVKIFEENFAKYINRKHFIGCANGTDALELAIQSLDLSENDEVIVQGNTYIATCLGVLNNNTKLILCDIDKDTHMIDIELMKSKINKNTKAIIVVHLYGIMPDMEKISSICKENNITLIEDCAQAHGAKWNGKIAGTFGKLACFSFYPGKNLGACGDAGGIGLCDDHLNDKIRKLLNLGCKVKYHHEIIGRNSRLDTLQAAILNVKLKHLDSWNKLRQNNASIYNNNLSDIDLIELPKIDDLCSPVYHLYVIKTNYRDELKEYLDNNKIPSLIHYPISIIETNAIKKYNYDFDLKYCIENSKKILSLPMYPELEENEIIYICNKIKMFFLEKQLLSLKETKTNNKIGILNHINNIQFNTKRIFYVTVDKLEENRQKNKRGFHVNNNFNELLFIIQGKVELTLKTKINTENKILNKNDIFLIKQNNWIEYEFLEDNTIIVVLCDKINKESISMYNYEEFINN